MVDRAAVGEHEQVVKALKDLARRLVQRRHDRAPAGGEVAEDGDDLCDFSWLLLVRGACFGFLERGECLRAAEGARARRPSTCFGAAKTKRTLNALYESSPLVGSSRKSRAGFLMSCMPILSRRFSPPLVTLVFLHGF